MKVGTVIKQGLLKIVHHHHYHPLSKKQYRNDEIFLLFY